MIVPTRGVYAKRWISRLNEKLITPLDSETLLSIYRFFVSFSAGYSYRLMKRRNVVYLKLINSRILADIIRKLDTRGLSIDFFFFFFSIVVKFVQLCFEHLQSMGGLILLYRRQRGVRLTKSDKYSFVFLFGSLRIFFLHLKKKKISIQASIILFSFALGLISLSSLKTNFLKERTISYFDSASYRVSPISMYRTH